MRCSCQLTAYLLKTQGEQNWRKYVLFDFTGLRTHLVTLICALTHFRKKVGVTDKDRTCNGTFLETIFTSDGLPAIVANMQKYVRLWTSGEQCHPEIYLKLNKTSLLSVLIFIFLLIKAINMIISYYFVFVLQPKTK